MSGLRKIFADEFYFEPNEELEISTDGNVLDYDNNILEYEVDPTCVEPIEVEEDEEIEEEDVARIRISPLDNLFLVEPIPTSQRLAAYPEMQMIRPRRAREVFMHAPPVPEAPEAPEAPDGPAKEISDLEVISENLESNKKTNKTGGTAPFQCLECGYWYRSEMMLANHQKLHEQNSPIPIPGFLCPMEQCGIRCDTQITLNEHVRIVHRRDDLVDQTFFFSNWTEFDLWKEALEESTKARFVRASGKYNATGRSTRYTCFFSNPYVRPSGRGIRHKPSRKHEQACTAYLTTRESYGKVMVTACLRHTGHEKGAHHLPLSASIRREIATLVMQGMSEDDIVETMRRSNSPDNRRYYLQPYEVRNVSRKLLKNQYKSDRMVELMQEEESAICEKNEEPGQVAENSDKKDDEIE